jgi:hypothetical protein
MSLVEEIFNRVVFDKEDRDYHFSLYNAVKELANGINEKCPDSPEKTLAFRAFHLGLMHVGAALAKHEKYKEEKAKIGVTE